MKIVLLKDVAKLGRQGEVREVSDGHARNFLFPKKIAAPATPERLRAIERELQKKSIAEKNRESEIALYRDSLKKKSFTIERKGTSQGSLYDAVKAIDILEAVNASEPSQLKEEHILLEQPIKHSGTYKIPVRIGKEDIELNLEVKSKA